MGAIIYIYIYIYIYGLCVAMQHRLHLIIQIVALRPTLCHLTHKAVIYCLCKMTQIRDGAEEGEVRNGQRKKGSEE